MPAKRRLTMRQLRQILRLAGDGTSTREIALTLGVARSTVQDNLKRAAAAGLRWPLYDANRPHSSLGNITPNEFAMKMAPEKQAT
nr:MULTISPECIES: helix-turn-helix domain-containing protein [unclassified Martelella]